MTVVPQNPKAEKGLPQGLKQRLRTANARELARLVEEHGRWLGLGEVRQVLLNPFVGPEVLESLASNRKLMAERTVRAAVAGHHRTPPPVSMRFVSTLFWRELLEIVLDVRVSAAVRRAAEKYLVQRLGRLSVGEKVALARRAVGRVARELVLDPSLGVLDAVLANPRITEQEIMPLLTAKNALPRALEKVARSERWGTRYEVRLALCRHPKTPSRDVVRLLPGLQREDLEAVAEIEEHGWLVRHRAREILDEWPFDRFRGRVREIAREEDRRIEIDAEEGAEFVAGEGHADAPLPYAALADAIDSTSS